jgi:hypothetical protein
MPNGFPVIDLSYHKIIIALFKPFVKGDFSALPKKIIFFGRINKKHLDNFGVLLYNNLMHYIFYRSAEASPRRWFTIKLFMLNVSLQFNIGQRLLTTAQMCPEWEDSVLSRRRNAIQ